MQSGNFCNKAVIETTVTLKKFTKNLKHPIHFSITLLHNQNTPKALPELARILIGSKWFNRLFKLVRQSTGFF